ncbi:membrane associated DnaJ chaperone-like protein [Xylariaceae sp. FL1651]|nr:membrane associated DnaJ chaperone-like protein [Xylariaceae sp. FL1651]
MSSNTLSLLGWMFLPNLVTGWAQSIYYGLTIRAGDPRPPPNSPRWQLHRRRIHTLVITLYLLYTIYEADWELRRAGTFYGDLGVSFEASERDIKSRFRRLAALHHPDKISHASSSGNGFESSTASGGAGDFFIHLKTASDVLTDPARRFAYERFGPDITGWRNCVTLRDYVWRGLQTQVIPHYGIAAAGLYILGLLGYLEFGRYWRWVTLVVLCAFEAHAVTRPRFPAFVEAVVNPLLVRFTAHPPYLPFQVVALARRVAIAIYIAFGQLGPIIQAGRNQEAAAGEKALLQNLERLEHTAKSVDVDVSRLMELEMAPFAGDPEVVRDMRSKLREWLVQNTIRADPMVRDALGRSLQKRRVDAPAGARGTR